MPTLDFFQFLQIAFPQVLIVVGAVVVLAVDLLLRQSPVKPRFAVASGLGIAASLGAIATLVFTSGQASVLQSVLLNDPLTRLVQIVLLTLTILVLFLAIDSTFTPHVGEFVLLILFATAGMMFLVSSQDLLVLFVSLELLSLCLYILTGFDKLNPRSTEAALKYFLFGAMSAAFLLYGFSLLYGMASSTLLPHIGQAVATSAHNPITALAIVMVVIGLGFKVAAAPFHFWAPDVYQGAPAPAAAFIASASKVASFFIFFIVILVGFRGSEGNLTLHHLASGWVPVLVVVAVVSMLLGNLAAIVQTSLRRLLAYSAVSHAGYMLLAIVAHTPATLGALLYYVATYALTTVGVFAILQAVGTSLAPSPYNSRHPERSEGPQNSRHPERSEGPQNSRHPERSEGPLYLSLSSPATNSLDRISALAGLSRRSPLLAACLAIFLLSLAGIPPLSGFFAKFYLFTAVLAAIPGSPLYLILVILAIAMSAVSLYYYLRVLKSAFIAEAPADLTPIHPPIITTLTIAAIALAVILLGCAPNLFVQWITSAVHTITG